MSFGNMQHQQQHPLLSAISGNNYAGTQRAHYPSWHQHSHQLRQNPYLQQSHGRPGQLLAAASNHNGAYASTASGHSGYGIEPSVEYELQQTPPSGSYSSYHPSSSGGGGSGPPAYPPPHHHHHHAPKSAPTTSAPKKKKKSSGSVMSALTLLSFFFFVNMLQSCIKEHITDMNPTVMVLTSSGSRNRFNKLAEMNSREQTSSPASTTASASASASWQLGAIASSAVVPVIVTPAVTLHTPYSSGLVTNKPPVSQSHSYQQQSPPHHHQHHDDDYNYGHHTPYSGSPSSADFYPNRTHIDQSLRPDSDYYHHHQQQQEHPPYYPERDRHQLTYMDNGYAWSYSPNGNSHSQSPFHTQSHSQLPSPLLLHSHSHSHAAGSKRYSSSASLGAQSGVSSYSDNARYRQDYADDNDQRYNINDQRHDDDSAAAEQRRRVDDFYTHNNN